MTALIELYANNAYSTLANSITAATTTINVVAGSKFPNPTTRQFFRMTITSASSPNSTIEIVYVTARSTNALTVLRGQEGTTAQSWSINDLCSNEATAGTYNQFMQRYYGIDTGAANVYVVETPTAGSSYYDGMMVSFKTLNASTSASPTLNVNGIGAAVVSNAGGTTLLSGQIPANTLVTCTYNTTTSKWELQSLNGVGITPPSSDSSKKLATTEFVQGVAGTSIPSGSVILFYQAAAPTGWTKLTTQNDKAIRVVSGTGGVAGGSVSFSTAFTSQALSGTIGSTILDITQIPSHDHGAATGSVNLAHTHTNTVSSTNIDHTHGGTTDLTNVDHYHAGTTAATDVNHQHVGSTDYMNTNNVHSHTYTKPTWRVNAGYDASSSNLMGNPGTANTSYNTGSTDINHYHTFTTSYAANGNINHSHGFSTNWASQNASVGAQNHQHNFTTGAMSANASHSHTVTNDSSLGTHSHSVTAQGGGAGHTHSLSGGTINLAVQYIDVILCSKN